MASTISPVQLSERITLKRLLWVGPLTIVAAIVANVIFQQSAVAILHPDPQFTGLTLVPAIVATFVGVLGAVVVYTLVQRGLNSMRVYAASALPLYVQANGLAIVRL